MRDGDIYRWTWKAELGRNSVGPFGDYHCKSRIAVFENGVLRDTFWGSGSDAHRVDPEKVELNLLGNRHDMTEIREWDVHYYRSEDVVDMRHSNNSRAPIYLKAGAKRSAKVMRKYAQEKIDEARREIGSAMRQIERMDECLAAIESGDLDAVHF